MKELIDMMRERRSVREYTGEEIAEEALEKILQAGLLSASGKGKRPFEFIVVKDRSALKYLSDCRVGSAKMLEGASCAIAVIADSLISDTIIEDSSIALANMHLMADSLGLGSCWIQCRMREATDKRSSEEYVRDKLKFPENYKLEAILSIGIPKNKPKAHDMPDTASGKVHYEKF